MTTAKPSMVDLKCSNCGDETQAHEGCYSPKCSQCGASKRVLHRYCPVCNKKLSEYVNYCSWDCHIEQAKLEGGKVHTPNGLPIKCIKWNNLMLEHEHGDHSDYKFPVKIEYVGNKFPTEEEQHLEKGRLYTPEEMKAYNCETHAFIYSDGYVAVTVSECCYAMWNLHTGECMGGSTFWTKQTYKLTQDSVDKLNEFTKDMRRSNESREM